MSLTKHIHWSWIAYIKQLLVFHCAFTNMTNNNGHCNFYKMFFVCLIHNVVNDLPMKWPKPDFVNDPALEMIAQLLYVTVPFLPNSFTLGNSLLNPFVLNGLSFLRNTLTLASKIWQIGRCLFFSVLYTTL